MRCKILKCPRGKKDLCCNYCDKEKCESRCNNTTDKCRMLYTGNNAKEE